jgi:cytochrome c biogenesis protein CcmG/thiol:disulfide interchange protein DsbE
MKYIAKIKFMIPFLILFTLLSMLTRELYSATSHDTISSEMIGEQVPAFSLPYLSDADKTLSQNVLKGHVSLINIWASWCSACKAEHSILMKIKNDYGIPIYGILYKDDASDALKYLTRHGNPYTEVGNDEYGQVGIDFGIYGTPETYVVSPTGEILYRQVGALDEYTWNKVIYPIIQHYAKKKS